MATTVTHIWRPSGARRVVLDGFIPIPRGTVPSTPAPLVWPAKDPADVLDYELDVTGATLANRGDRISTLDVAISPGAAGDLVLNSSAADGAIAVFWFGGGQIGINYMVTVTIGTTSGRTISRVIVLPVQSLATSAAPLSTLQTDAGLTVTDQNGNPILIGS